MIEGMDPKGKIVATARRIEGIGERAVWQFLQTGKRVTIMAYSQEALDKLFRKVGAVTWHEVDELKGGK